MCQKSGITAVTDSNGVTLSDDKDIANALTDYFASVGVASNNFTRHIRNLGVPSLHSMDFGEHDISAAIDKLKNNLSADPDCLPPLLFKRIKFSIVEPLMLVYKQLLSVSYVPHIWKKAVVTPVHNKKLSYRRVTARCVLSVVILPITTQQCRNYLYDKS